MCGSNLRTQFAFEALRPQRKARRADTHPHTREARKLTEESGEGEGEGGKRRVLDR